VNRGTEEMRNISSGAFAPSAPGGYHDRLRHSHRHLSTLYAGNWKVWSGPFALASLWDPDSTKSYPNIRLFAWLVGGGHFWSLLGIIAQLTDHSWNSLTTNKKMSWFQLEPGGLRNPAMRPSSRRRHCCRWKLRLNAGSKPLNYVGSCWFQLLL
jgi:hypothetical protein